MPGFAPFSLVLANEATVSGIACVPSGNKTANRPLVVLLHGGGCTSNYWDFDEGYTASTIAQALGVVVVAINRPCYLDSTSLLPAPEDSSFHQETGRWEHKFIFPTLWQKYGVVNGCNGIVAMAHSMASPGAIVAASLYSQDSQPKYPLCGLIISGWGFEPNIESQREWVGMSKEQKKESRHIVMLSGGHYNAADPKLRPRASEYMTPGPPEENQECVDGPWGSYWQSYAREVTVPIMYGVGEHDWLWRGTREHVSKYEAFFSKCPRFDGSVVQGAPHAIEWSYSSFGWYTRCFGFALEVAAAPLRRS